VEVDSARVTGTLIWYYHICKREVWLMAHNIAPEQDDPYIDLGRFIQENTYRRDRKEISLGNVKLDIIRQADGQIVVGEVKKSSRFKNSARMQLAYYLLELKNRGIDAKGVLMFPKEKRKEDVELNDQLIEELKAVEKDIFRIIYSPRPQGPAKIPYCKNCGYKEFCWS
jgi:CRISPR-associated exonuclease Cas4